VVAVIDESACIGCALCLEPCPVDAIVGAARYTHTVVADHCTGCELCVPACPVDCIALVPRAPAGARRGPFTGAHAA
jgi:electron transport complex protein RnfB